MNACPYDCAYAAGIVDGEGCITILERVTKRGGRSFMLSVIVNQNDPRLSTWLASRWGGKTTERPAPKSAHTQFRWKLTGPTALALLNDIRPFTVIKAEQIDVARKFQSKVTRSPTPLTVAQIDERLALKLELSALKKQRFKRHFP